MFSFKIVLHRKHSAAVPRNNLKSKPTYQFLSLIFFCFSEFNISETNPNEKKIIKKFSFFKRFLTSFFISFNFSFSSQALLMRRSKRKKDLFIDLVIRQLPLVSLLTHIFFLGFCSTSSKSPLEIPIEAQYKNAVKFCCSQLEGMTKPARQKKMLWKNQNKLWKKECRTMLVLMIISWQNFCFCFHFVLLFCKAFAFVAKLIYANI